MIRHILTPCALLFVLAAAAQSSLAAEVQGTARLLAPEGSVAALKAVATLPVQALPVAIGEPVKADTVLVEMNVEKLDREMSARQKDLKNIQNEKRFRASNREVSRGGGGSRAFQGPDNGIDSNLAIKEADATRDLLEVQTALSTASPRAPADGYVVRSFYSVGAEAKRRKPVVTFIEATKTVLTIAVAAGQAGLFPPGTEVTIVSQADASQRFRGTVQGASADGESLAIRPLELPFLALDRPTPVTITPAP